MLLRGTLVLLLASAALPRTVAGAGDVGELHRTVTAHYYAIGENRLAEAMSFYHEGSPQADEARRQLMVGQTAYLQRTSTVSFDVVFHHCRRAVVLAIHRHLRIAGVKFMHEITETRYLLRKQGGAWKIWSSVSRSPRR